jgi:hypothetical protein
VVVPPAGDEVPTGAVVAAGQSEAAVAVAVLGASFELVGQQRVDELAERVGSCALSRCRASRTKAASSRAS